MKDKLQFLILFLAVIFFYSCQNTIENETEEVISLKEELSLESDGQVVLGEKLENPYSVENMRKAYASLTNKLKKTGKRYASKTLEGTTAIEITDYYVRFWIENDEQRNVLVADSLNLSILPLDVEIEEEGDYYVDENTEIEQAQWLYTSVEKNYQFPPEITYEILEELFLFEEPETEEDTLNIAIAGKGNISKNFLLDLEDEALRITNNLEKPEKGTKLAARRRRVKPYGWIRVINTTNGREEGVEGVKVVTRRWFKWGSSYTTSNGYYKINRSYKRDVNYKIHFENKKGFKIWQSLVNISYATYRMGKHSKNGRSITFNTNSVGWNWSTVNNATVQYLKYCDQFNIGKPHDNLRIVASRGTGSSSAPMLRRTLNHITVAKAAMFLTAVKFGVAKSLLWIVARFVLPDIIIRANSSNGTDGVYTTTFHELAHASHYKKVGNGYWRKYIDKIIDNWMFHNSTAPYGSGRGNNHELVGLGEAWGFHVGFFFTIERFGVNNRVRTLLAFEDFDPLTRPNGDGVDRFVNSWRGWMPLGIMHDLIDTNRDFVREGFRDNVEGYTLKNIYDALDADVETPQQFRDRLLQENSNRDEADVRNLFEAYYWN